MVIKTSKGIMVEFTFSGMPDKERFANEVVLETQRSAGEMLGNRLADGSRSGDARLWVL